MPLVILTVIILVVLISSALYAHFTTVKINREPLHNKDVYNAHEHLCDTNPQEYIDNAIDKTRKQLTDAELKALTPAEGVSTVKVKYSAFPFIKKALQTAPGWKLSIEDVRSTTSTYVSESVQVKVVIE